MRNIVILFLAVLALVPRAGFAQATPSPRQIVSLNEAGWRFQYGAQPETVTRADFNDSGWERVSVPHSWNRIGEYSLARSAATNNKQGVGWYRLSYTAPAVATKELKSKRFYLDFAAVGAIADVWVNGVQVGTHKGAFSRFRFDVTAAWKPGATNVIAVKADNSKAAPGSSTEHVLPLAGDFFIHGGMYRGVQLITANDVGIDLLDFGGPGVYVDSTFSDLGLPDHVTPCSGKVALRNQSNKKRFLKFSIEVFERGFDQTNSLDYEVSIPANSNKRLNFPIALCYTEKLWTINRPQMQSLKISVSERGKLVDQMSVPFGLRNFKFDANNGFIPLNKESRPEGGITYNDLPLKLRGVSRHQDRMGKGNALTREDHAEDMRLIKEMGANSVRHAHYQHADEWAEEADKAGMLVWAELPFVTTPSFTGGEGSPELWKNAEQQLRELIRQNYNHPSIVMWSIGNEVDASTLFGASKEPAKPLALLKHLQKIAKEEDPTRPTIFADCCEDVSAGFGRTAGEKLAGTADLIGYNRYFGWYMPKPLNAAADFGAMMDKLHTKHPALPISISEYGAGGAVDQFSDNPTGGFVNFIGRPQPEAYEAWVHEQTWPVIRSRKYIFGSWVWNMFDFASDLRNEGDSVDINTKGLVTFDRKIKKDAFYYYKAQWSAEPVLHLTGKRYINRSYSVTDFKAYTNNPRATLQINGRDLNEVVCPDGICIWQNVQLAPGENRVTVHSGELADKATFIGPDPAKGIRINAGTNAVTQVNGVQFGSDNFHTGGTAMPLNMGSFGNKGAAKKVVASDRPALFDYWREGDAFSYSIPVPNGKWMVTVHSLVSNSASQRMIIAAQGKALLTDFNSVKEPGGTLKGISTSFPVIVKGGLLRLDFAGLDGSKAVVAAIEVTK